MRVIGRGLIAQALRRYLPWHEATTAFATGVGDSTCHAEANYAAERQHLASVLAECRAEHHKLIYFSTATHVHGTVEGPRHEGTPIAPVTPYGHHKALSEALIRQSDCRYLIVRLANLVGPHQNQMQLVPQLISQIVQGHVRVHAHATRDLLDVRDLAQLLQAVLERNADHETLVVAAGISTPVVTLVDWLQSALGTNALVECLDRGDRQEFDISQLKRAAPQAGQFPASYPRSVIQHYAELLLHDARRVASG